MVHSAARMELRIRRSGGVAVLAVSVATAISACADSGNGTSGSSGSGAAPTAQSLLRDSLQGNHRITSGVLSLRATMIPHGSTAGSQPITISFGGPFESPGSGRGTESDFTVAVAAGGQRLSLGVRTTATAGYMRLNGSWFRLPAKQFAQLRKGLAASGGSGSASLPGLSASPLKWLNDPQLLGDTTVDGTPTTEIQAWVDVPALASELGSLFAKEAALRSSGLPAKLSAAQRRQLVSELDNPTVQLFIASADHTLRRAALDLTLKLPAKTASKLPGISSLGVAVTVDYAQVNRPQTITAPAQVKPYSQLGQQLSGLEQTLEGSAAGTTGSATNNSDSVANGSGSAAAGGHGKYYECLQKSGGNLTKLQKCASLIDSAGQ
jgi:hypothetical protein